MEEKSLQSQEAKPGFDYSELDHDSRSFIRQRADLIRSLVKRTAESIIDTGKALADAKERLPHGKWLPWLEAEFGWSDRTAENYINVATHLKFETVSNLDNISLGALYQIVGSRTPKPVRDEVLQRAERGERITRKTVAEITARVAEGTAAHPPDPEPQQPIPIETRKKPRPAKTAAETLPRMTARRAAAADMKRFGAAVQFSLSHLAPAQHKVYVADLESKLRDFFTAMKTKKPSVASLKIFRM